MKQLDHKFGALTRLAADVDRATHPVHDLPADSEPETHTSLGAFGGKEGSEDLLLVGRTDAASVIDRGD